MSSVFPGAVDDFDTSMLPGGLMNSPSHAAQHQKIGDALEKLETHALQAFRPDTALASSVAAGTAAFTVTGPAPPAMFGAQDTFVFAIEEGSYKCEVVQVRSLTGNQFTLTSGWSFHFDHPATASVRWLRDGYSYPALFGGACDASTDDWRAIQRCFMTGKCRGQHINAFKQPLFFGGGMVADDWNIWAVNGYAPVQADPLSANPTGYAVTGARQSFVFTGADPATGRIAYAGGTGEGAFEADGVTHKKIALNDPYNDGGLPGGVTAGRIYWISSMVDTPGSAYFTLSSTPDGLTPVTITSTGKGVFWMNMDSDISQLQLRKFRLELNYPDVSGMRVFPQQPSLFDSMYVSMNRDCSAPKKAVGLSIGGQGAEFRNLNVNTQDCVNVLGTYVGSSFICFAGLTCCVGLGQHILIASQGVLFDLLELESYTVCGVELTGVCRNIDLGLVYDASGHTNAPCVLDSTPTGADWRGRFNVSAGAKKVIVSPLLDAPLYSWDGGPPQTGITDQNTVTPEIVSNAALGYGGGGIAFSTRGGGGTNGADADWAFRQIYRWWNIRAEAANRTGTLHSAVGFCGLDYLVRRSSGTRNVIIAAPAGQTINGAATFTITDGNVHTIWSDGGSWFAA